MCYWNVYANLHVCSSADLHVKVFYIHQRQSFTDMSHHLLGLIT